jgi:acetolactate synthase-1/2/3 large subunit
MLGMHGTAYANYAVEDCDFHARARRALRRSRRRRAGKFAPRAKFIAQIDIDPAEIGKVKHGALASQRRSGARTLHRLRNTAKRTAFARRIAR